MCELIVKAVDATHPDPEKDRRGCYKRGYPVAVYPDGTKWGACECLPRFVIIKFPGVPVDNPIVQKYTKPHIEPCQQTRSWNIIEWNRAVARSKYREFLSKPVVLSTVDEPFEKIITLDQWQEMQDENDYYPFFVMPTIEILIGEITGIKLSGTVRLVELQGDINTTIIRRLWQIRWASLPLVARNKLASLGELVIKVGLYGGTYDYTWAQVKGYFRNQQTNLDETEDL